MGAAQQPPFPRTAQSQHNGACAQRMHRYANYTITSYQLADIIKLIKSTDTYKIKKVSANLPVSKPCLNLSKLCQNAFTLKALARVLTK